MKVLLAFVAVCGLLFSAKVHGEFEPSQSALVVVLLGPPGSGKGTQAVKLSQKLGLPHISTGDIFRENIKNKTPLGLKAGEYIEKGRLVPDEVTLDMLFARVSHIDCAHGYLLDGFPRTVAQAEVLDKRLPGATELVVMNLEVPDSTIVKRVVGRLMCRACGNIQHKDFSPPRVADKCDKCGGELYQRTDDTETVIKERLRIYHEQTKPVIAYYKEKGLIQEVNGEQAPERVFEDLFAEIMGD